MSDKLIKNVAFDIISVTSIWGLLNIASDLNSIQYSHDYTYYNNKNNYKKYLFIPICKNIIGLTVSIYVLRKYM